MENKRPIQRRDFLKSATAASVLAGAATLAARADEVPVGTSLVGQEAADCVVELLRGMPHVRSIFVFEGP